MTEVVSLGLDGAAWHELDRLMDRGDLPNMAKLVDRGVRAPLRSVDPPVTCPAWRCSTAGKNPGKLGVYWWLDFDRETGEFTTPDATAFDTADVWDYLSEAGYRSAVLNVPMTYPPARLDGVMVSGFGAPFDTVQADDVPITYPDEFQTRLQEEYDWAVGVDDLTGPGGPERAHDLIRTRFELLTDLVGEGFDYVHLTVFYINMLQHKFGNGEETVEGWRIIDDYLGDLLAEDVLLLLYSDHGHSTVERTFSVNRWLLEQGYLSVETRAGDSLLTNLYEGLKSVGVSPRRTAGVAKRLLPSSVYDTLITSGYPISSRELSARVDWSESAAVALSQGPVYVNRSRLGEEYAQFRRELRRRLASTRHEGDRVFDAVEPAETVYDGPYVRDGPDLVLRPADGWELYGGITTDVVESQVTSWTSGNHPVGMLAMAGDGVADAELDERSLLDIHPTVLQYMGCDVPTDLDGEVIDEAFAADIGEPSPRPPIDPQRADAGRNDALQSRLADLGYLE